MKAASVVLGLVLVVGGVALGLYVGVWLFLIGGIVQIIEQIKADDLNALAVGIGVARVLLAGAAGTLSFWFSAILGAGFVKAGLDG
jgi:hypothetical protein